MVVRIAVGRSSGVTSGSDDGERDGADAKLVFDSLSLGCRYS